MTYTNVAAGDPILASTINDLIKYGPAKPACMLQQQAAQAIASNTDTVLTFGAGSEVYDDLNWHSTTVNTSRITPTVAGRYKVTARSAYAFNFAIAASSVFVYKNGAIIDRIPNIKHYNKTAGGAGTDPLNSNTATNGGEMVTYVDCNGTTDYLEMGVNQVSVAAVSQNTNAASSGRSTFTVELERAA
jgi:hypothetical protein